MNLLEEIKTDYELCINNPHEYQKKVDSISDLFSLKGRQRLKGDNCPAYIIGKYETSPFVMFGINPGYSRKNNPVEDMEARKSWDDYQNLNLNFFQFFSEHKFESPYYTALGHLLAGLTGAQDKSKWDIFDSYLTNLELIPYHSEGLTLPSRLSSHLDYLQTRLRRSIDFITKFRPRLFLFNGNPWYVLLVKNSLVNKYYKVQVSKLFNLYFFELEVSQVYYLTNFFKGIFGG
jgi:hypothetical protein